MVSVQLDEKTTKLLEKIDRESVEAQQKAAQLAMQPYVLKMTGIVEHVKAMHDLEGFWDISPDKKSIFRKDQ